MFNGLHDAAAISASQHEIPPCVRNVIMHQIKSPPKLATENPKKKIKKLSKTITLPEDPYDPTAFTLHFDQYDEYSLMRRQQMKNAKARKSRHTVKVVGSFSFLMTIGIIITVLCFLCEYKLQTWAAQLGRLNVEISGFFCHLCRFYVKSISKVRIFTYCALETPKMISR